MSEKIVRFMDSLFGDGDSSNDARFKFSVGDTVKIDLGDVIHMWPEGTQGHTGKILDRRNAYPPPHFQGYWCPIYYVDGVGEVGENQIELAEGGL
jgi:hypothetical protein